MNSRAATTRSYFFFLVAFLAGLAALALTGFAAGLAFFAGLIGFAAFLGAAFAVALAGFAFTFAFARGLMGFDGLTTLPFSGFSGFGGP